MDDKTNELSAEIKEKLENIQWILNNPPLIVPLKDIMLDIDKILLYTKIFGGSITFLLLVIAMILFF